MSWWRWQDKRIPAARRDRLTMPAQWHRVRRRSDSGDIKDVAMCDARSIGCGDVPVMLTVAAGVAAAVSCAVNAMAFRFRRLLRSNGTIASGSTQKSQVFPYEVARLGGFEGEIRFRSGDPGSMIQSQTRLIAAKRRMTALEVRKSQLAEHAHDTAPHPHPRTAREGVQVSTRSARRRRIMACFVPARRRCLVGPSRAKGAHRRSFPTQLAMAAARRLAAQRFPPGTMEVARSIFRLSRAGTCALANHFSKAF